MLRLLLIFCLLCGLSLPAQACFGPKLYVAVGPAAGQELMFALVSLYVHEKTGTDAVAVTTPGEPLTLLEEEKVDLALTRRPSQAPVLLDLGALGRLRSGPRPLQQLQFTLVPRALAKLQRLLQPDDLKSLHARIAAGEPVKAAVRRLLTEKGWI